MKQFKIIVEKHSDTYVAYPLGIKGVVVGQGDAYETAVADVKSAIKFHSKHSDPKTWELILPTNDFQSSWNIQRRFSKSL